MEIISYWSVQFLGSTSIILLLSVYGLRRQEVINLSLDNINWEKEKIILQRTKNFKTQIFPLVDIVAEAIARYIHLVRPNHTKYKEIFMRMRAPYRPLSPGAVFNIVNLRFKSLNVPIKHHGPHALRHACATHLINQGISLKNISDHLGHRSIDSTRIYTKVDLKNLKRVADFSIGDLL